MSSSKYSDVINIRASDFYNAYIKLYKYIDIVDDDHGSVSSLLSSA